MWRREGEEKVETEVEVLRNFKTQLLLNVPELACVLVVIIFEFDEAMEAVKV